MNNLTNILDQKSALVNKLKDVDLQNKKGKQEVATVKIENVSGRNLILTKSDSENSLYDETKQKVNIKNQNNKEMKRLFIKF